MIVALFRRSVDLCAHKSGLFENQYHSQDGVGEETVTFFRYTLGLLLVSLSVSRSA